MTKVLREWRNLIANEGAEVLKVEQGRHYKIHMRAPDGRTQFVVAARTPSCRHAIHNDRSLIRRFVRGINPGGV